MMKSNPILRVEDMEVVKVAISIDSKESVEVVVTYKVTKEDLAIFLEMIGEG